MYVGRDVASSVDLSLIQHIHHVEVSEGDWPAEYPASEQCRLRRQNGHSQPETPLCDTPPTDSGLNVKVYGIEPLRRVSFAEIFPFRATAMCGFSLLRFSPRVVYPPTLYVV